MTAAKIYENDDVVITAEEFPESKYVCLKATFKKMVNGGHNLFATITISRDALELRTGQDLDMLIPPPNPAVRIKASSWVHRP